MIELLAFTVDVYMPGTLWPMVRHEFMGETKEEAEEHFRAHCGVDRFLSAAAQGQPIDGIACKIVYKWRKVVLEPSG